MIHLELTGIEARVVGEILKAHRIHSEKAAPKAKRFMATLDTIIDKLDSARLEPQFSPTFQWIEEA